MLVRFAASRTSAAGAAGLGLLALVVVSVGAAHAVRTSPGVYAGTAAGAVAAYLLGVLLVRSWSCNLAVVLIVAAAIQLAPLAGPLILSQDALAYWAYGRVSAVHDVSPYSVAPDTFPEDPATRAMGGGWRDRTSVYGPLFTLAAEAEADATGASAGDAATFYKVAGAAGMLAITVLVALLSAQPALAAAAVGWNPLFALQFAGGGHNDVWMIALLLGALALERRGLRQVAGFVWACAAGIKWIPLLLLPFHALRPRTRFGWTGAVAGAATLMLVAWLRYGTSWLGAFLPLAHDVGAGTRDGLLRLLGAPPPVAVALGAAACWARWCCWRRGRAPAVPCSAEPQSRCSCSRRGSCPGTWFGRSPSLRPRTISLRSTLRSR